ncbi:MAG: helix-turn-helix domain-containing protein [Kiritimatiellia bacterium]|nr:helix-turn-helix domain-containing protein [Kiritimatiellia bacterium]
MSIKEILVNGKPETAYGIIGTEETEICDYSHDGHAHKVQDKMREQQVWHILFRDRAFEFAPALPEGTVLTLDNIARVDYGKHSGDEENEIPPFNINFWWYEIELIFSDKNRIWRSDGGLSPIKPLIAQEKAVVEQGNTAADDRMLTIKEAAAYAKVDERTIRDWLQRNEGTTPMLPGVVKSGRLYRIPQRALDTWRKPYKAKRNPIRKLQKHTVRKAVKRRR